MTRTPGPAAGEEHHEDRAGTATSPGWFDYVLDDGPVVFLPPPPEERGEAPERAEDGGAGADAGTGAGPGGDVGGVATASGGRSGTSLAVGPAPRSAADGVTGEYRPEPIELDVPRLRPGGQGLSGIASAGEMSRHEHLKAVRSGDIGSVHSWELVTAVDGPGTRLTVFLSGCPLRCLYCHNPDTFYSNKGHPVLLKDLVKRVKRYRGVFRATGGGLTISGGEPLFQARYVKKLLRAAKELGVHTALDTSGFLGAYATDELLDDVDLVLLDLKSGDPEVYRATTGRELQPTLDFGRRLAARGTEVWVRFVLVPGLTDDEANVEAVAAHAASFGNVSRVEVLPFHQMGRDKWATLGLDYELDQTQPPSNDLLERVRAQFRAHGLTTY